MNKELIELQKGVNATCVVIKDDDYNLLGSGIQLQADIENKYLYSSKLGNPLFKEKLDKISKENETTYFVIRNIDKIDKQLQDRFITIVKDREFHGYSLPQNVIMVFTVQNKESLKNISSGLYHFMVVAF